MKSIFFSILVLVPIFAWATLCDDTYYLQSITQTMISGNNPRLMNDRQIKTVLPDLSNLTILNKFMNYTILVGFDGACARAQKPVRFKTKGASQTTFTDSVDNQYQVEIYDTNTHLENFKFDYWFGFYKTGASPKFFLGMEHKSDNVFTNYYAAVIYTDSTRNPAGPLGDKWQPSAMHYYNLSGPSDSASLDNGLLDATGVRKLVVDENHQGIYTIQFLKVIYGNRVPIAIKVNRMVNSDFHAKQIGDMILIQVGGKNLAYYGALNLFNMTGNKIASLPRIGNSYQWNGTTTEGASASAGVYFVQAQNTVLGKIYYSR